MLFEADIDIDFPSDVEFEKLFPQSIRASMVKDKDIMPHQCGRYFQNIPIDSITQISAIPYEEAKKIGFTKIDFLTLTALDDVPKNMSKKDIRNLLKEDPDWDLLLIPSVVKKLIHIHNYYDLIVDIRPTSVQEIADILALMRPGKKHLKEQYMVNRDETRKELFKRPSDGKFYFKKAHAVSYAMVIVLQLQLIKKGIL